MNKLYKYTEGQINEIIRLDKTGMSSTLISNMLNIPRSSIRSIINRNAEKFKCDRCGKSFPSYSHLDRHGVVHGIIEKPVTTISKKPSTFSVYVFLNGNKASLSEVVSKLESEAKNMLLEIESFRNGLNFFERFDQVLVRFSELQCSVSNLKEAKLQLERRLFRASEVVHSQD